MNKTTTINAGTSETAENRSSAGYVTSGLTIANTIAEEPAEHARKILSVVSASSALIVVSCAPCF
jgi:hypothetical protein